MEQIAKYIPWALAIWVVSILIDLVFQVVVARVNDELIESQRTLIAAQKRTIELYRIHVGELKQAD